MLSKNSRRCKGGIVAVDHHSDRSGEANKHGKDLLTVMIGEAKERIVFPRTLRQASAANLPFNLLEPGSVALGVFSTLQRRWSYCPREMGARPHQIRISNKAA